MKPVDYIALESALQCNPEELVDSLSIDLPHLSREEIVQMLLNHYI